MGPLVVMVNLRVGDSAGRSSSALSPLLLSFATTSWSSAYHGGRHPGIYGNSLVVGAEVGPVVSGRPTWARKELCPTTN
eukprot:1259016-Pyramimonas_sp.AAC.1